MIRRPQSLLSILDLDADSLGALVARGLELKRKGSILTHALHGRIVGQLFTRPSTRTRTSFFWAVAKMGGSCLTYDGDALQLGNGESLQDTAMALSHHLDVLVVRTNGPHQDLCALREHAPHLAIVNALCEREHPTQAIADLITMREQFGKLDGRHLVYVGLPCNTMNSLLLASAMLGEMRITVLQPASAPGDSWLRGELAKLAPQAVKFVSEWSEIDGKADVVYATRWESMGAQPALPNWREHRAQLALDARRLDQVLSEDGIFMHDLPATRGGEVDDAALDGPRSRIRPQSFNKGISAAVALERAIAD